MHRCCTVQVKHNTPTSVPVVADVTNAFPFLSLQAEMKKKVDKWQEPAPAKQHKVLPVPDMEPKKRRGGRRFRKMKERYGLTDMRKAANR